MAEQDPYDKITELTNERNDALAKVRELEGVSARLSSVQDGYRALQEADEALHRRFKEAQAELKQAHIDRENADTARMRAEDELEQAKEKITDLSDKLNRARQHAEDAERAKSFETQRADQIDARHHALKGEVRGFVSSVSRLLGGSE